MGHKQSTGKEVAQSAVELLVRVAGRIAGMLDKSIGGDSAGLDLGKKPNARNALIQIQTTEEKS